MSLEQQNLERYRQSLEARRGLVLTAVAVVLGLFAGFTAQGSWQTWLTSRLSSESREGTSKLPPSTPGWWSVFCSAAA